jgi:hypothetical protein
MEVSMFDYRCYYLDEAGHILTGEWVPAEHEEDAWRAATNAFYRPAKSGAVEMWFGERLLGRRSLLPHSREGASG